MKEENTMNSKYITPPNWYDIYPQNTKKGDEEASFFIALTRNQKWSFRSTAQLAKECNLSKERIEEIIEKYYKLGMVFPNPANDEQWGYWERNRALLPTPKTRLVDTDHAFRMNDMIYLKNDFFHKKK